MTWLIRHPLALSGLVRTAADPLESLHQEIDRTFGDFWNTPSLPTGSFKLDVKEQDTAFLVTADLPGLDAKEVDLSFEDGVLTIRGEKKIDREEKGATWHVVERSSGSFARQLALGNGIDPEKIEATFDKGVLCVTLPKRSASESKTKKIEVQTAS